MRSKETAHTILIATTNSGKFEEITGEFKDLPFTFVSLKDVKLDAIELEEPYNTTWENAVHKAKFFAEKSGLTTIAEDSGLFIDYLNGAPGVQTKNAAPTPEGRVQKIIAELAGIPKNQRKAHFETSGCVFFPETGNFSVFKGQVNGEIAESAEHVTRKGMEHDTIFYYPPAKKLFVEMTPMEKNQVSHRGQVVTQLKFFLQKQFGFKQIVVPLAMIIKDNKLLMLKRRDSRPEFNNKWEFPGGGVEKGEEVTDCVKRECKEETGFVVKIEEQIPKVLTHYESKWNYQVFLIMFVCTVESGALVTADNENSGSGWFTLEEALQQDLLPLNKKLIEDNSPTLKKYFTK